MTKLNLNTYTLRKLNTKGLLDDPDAILELIRIGRRLRAIYTDQCNGFQDNLGGWDSEADEKAKKEANKLEDKARAIVKAMGAYIYIQTDPRGATIYIDSGEIPADNYNQAVCIE